MRTALLDLPSQTLTSVLEPRFRRLGRKLILRIAFGKVGGSISQSNSTKIAVVFTTAISVELMEGYVFLGASDCKPHRISVCDFSFVFAKIP